MGARKYKRDMSILLIRYVGGIAKNTLILSFISLVLPPFISHPVLSADKVLHLICWLFLVVVTMQWTEGNRVKNYWCLSICIVLRILWHFHSTKYTCLKLCFSLSFGLPLSIISLCMCCSLAEIWSFTNTFICRDTWLT